MFRILFLLFPLLATLPAHATPTVITGYLDPGKQHHHALPLPPGTYVQGTIAGAGLELVLVNAQGQHLRRLSQGLRDEDDFIFLVPGGPLPAVPTAGQAETLTDARLEIRAPGGSHGGAYRIELDGQLPTLPDSANGSLPVTTATAATAPAPAVAPASPRLRALKPADVDAFWQELLTNGGPLVEQEGVQPPLAADERLVTFLWRGAKHGVRLHGGPSADHEELQRLPGTDLWYRSYRLPDSTRLAYRLAPDVPLIDGPPMSRRRAILATAQRDPLNPRHIPAQPVDVWDGYSLIELPAAPPTPWNEPRPGVPVGQLESHRFTSHRLGNTRDIQLYRPAGWRPGQRGNALLVVFDGESYTRQVPTPTILDNLIAAGRLPSTAAIFISNPSNDSRSRELPPNADFARFLAEELMPWARQKGVSAAAARTVVAGASYGGLAAAWAGFRHPEWFGKVFSQSGSFWWAPDWENARPFSRQPEQQGEWLTRQFAGRARLPLNFLLDAGLFETGRNGDIGIRDATRHLRDVLQARGYPVMHREFAAAHGYEHWRATLADGLLLLLGQP